VDVLVTETAARRFADRLDDGVTLLRMQADGTVLRDGEPVEWDDAAPEVAWASADLFDEGAPLRPFFGFLVRRAEAIRWLQSSAAGVDAPVFADLVGAGVRLTTSHVTDIPIAEYVLRAVLEHFQQAHQWRANQEQRGWERHDFREVAGSTWLVVGLGAIGTAVATRAAAFGATVLGVRRRPDGDEPVAEVLTPDALLDAVPRADVVVLSAPATADTTHLVDAAFLERMKEGSVLVNIARGALVDEAALLAALDAGRPGAALLDVTATEPLPGDSPLWAHPRVTLTPHNAAGGTGRLGRAADLFADNLRRYRAGEALRHEVDPSDLQT
jgi:phosphoglycerate dehydrogenase-like enzyme